VNGAWPFVTMALLGAYHGLNPAMGWLFAVSLGLQDGDRRSVVRALPSIAVGHELAIALVAGAVIFAGVLTDPAPLHVGAAIALIAFGLFRFARPRAHPRWTKMRVNRRELTWWSFLMSSAHGAGLMVAPVLLAGASLRAGDGDHAMHAGVLGLSMPSTALALMVHVAAMIATMGLVSVLVYDRFATSILRRTWLNLDRVWAAAFLVAGGLTLVS
jgi:hypothetical protein